MRLPAAAKIRKLRCLAEKRRLAPKVRLTLVPGYIGVTTEEDENGRFLFPWEPDYEGMFRVHVWDTERAVFRSGGTFEDLEDAAREYDLIATVLGCGDMVDTNYPVPTDLPEKLGFTAATRTTKSPAKSPKRDKSAKSSASASASAAADGDAPVFTKHGVFSAMQLLDIEDRLTWEARSSTRSFVTSLDLRLNRGVSYACSIR